MCAVFALNLITKSLALWIRTTALPAITLFLSSEATHAVTYPFPAQNDSVVGAIQSVSARYEDTLLDIAVKYDVGQDEIVLANPHVDRWLPGDGTPVVIPSSFVLPETPYEGLVLNLPEMRLYYYPKARKGEAQEVQTFPVSIGRREWYTPEGITKVVTKVKNPAWYPPDSIRKEHEERGEPLPAVVPAGPDNPLGDHALLLDIPGYLIHGTNKTFGIGLQVSHGCIRMSPKDVELLFSQVAAGTVVRLVNQPVKVGWKGDTLYMEVHPQLDSMQEKVADANLSQTANEAIAKAQKAKESQTRRQINLDTTAIEAAIRSSNGLPIAIGELYPEPPELILPAEAGGIHARTLP